MSNNVFSAGSIDIDQSITSSSNTSTALDNFTPFTFFEFLKHAKLTTTPELFTVSYNQYIHDWHRLKNLEVSEAEDEIKTRYIELLKDVAFNYTTAEERRFLSNLDYDNPSDLSIAVPFYAQKLKEICLFYAKKRDSLKNRVQEIKVKGSAFSIERAVFQIITDYINISTDVQVQGTLNHVASALSINIVEYYDEYNDYFDVEQEISPQTLGIENEKRKKYLTSNTNPISASLFLDFDNTILNQVATSSFYLKEIGEGLKINPKLLIDKAQTEACDVQSLQQNIDSFINELSGTQSLKKQLIEKYIGADFYFLSSNSINQFVSGSLFKAANPSGNLLNKRFVTTASIPEDQLISLQQIGLFFKPSKRSIIQFNNAKSHYIVDKDLIEPDKIYIFPDPAIYGNVSNFYNGNFEYPLIHIIDGGVNVNKIDKGIAYGQIINNDHFQNYFAYFSEPLYTNTTKINLSSFDPHLMRVFDRGSFSSYAQDVYGNEYGVIKQIQRYNKTQTNSNVFQGQCIVIDGYSFFDPYESYSFNYSTTGTNYDGSIRTGLTSQTVELFPPGEGSYSTGYTTTSANMFTLSSSFYTIYFREFIPYIDCTIQTSYKCIIRDGGFFTAGDETILDFSSDSNLWSVDTPVYYNTLCDAAISATYSMTPAKLSGDFTAFVTLSSSNSRLFDGRLFNLKCTVAPDNYYGSAITNYIDAVNDDCVTVLATETLTGDDTINEINRMEGILLVKNVATNTVGTLSASLSATFSKYPQAVKDELYSNNILTANVYFDSIIINTTNYTVFDKILINNAGAFTKPGTRNNYIEHVPSNFSRRSNQFLIEETSDVWFSTITLLSTLSASNVKTFIPKIYKYNTNNNTLEQKYPLTITDSLTATFASGLTGVNILGIDDVRISYAEYNDKFNLLWTGTDLNNMCYTFSIWFNYYNDTVIIDSDQIAVYKQSTTPITYNFYYPLSALSDFTYLSTTQTTAIQNNNFVFFN